MEKIDQTYDPFTGVVTRTGFVDDKLVVRKDADISQAIAYTTALRNADEYWKNGVKNNFAHAAHIPEIVIVKLLQAGINIYDKNIRAKDIVAGLKKIGYEYLLTTTKRV